jgi:hypothetical protein
MAAGGDEARRAFEAMMPMKKIDIATIGGRSTRLTWPLGKLECALLLTGIGDDQKTEIRRLTAVLTEEGPEKPGRRRNLGTFGSRAAAEKHERAVQFFKRH